MEVEKIVEMRNNKEYGIEFERERVIVAST